MISVRFMNVHFVNIDTKKKNECQEKISGVSSILSRTALFMSRI